MAKTFHCVHGVFWLRPVIALAALLATAALDVQPVRAQGVAPWCLNGAIAYSFDCRYYTLEQCVATSRGLGGICTRNPRGAPDGRNRRPRRDNWDRW